MESLKCEVIFVWLSAYPSKCRGDLSCALTLVRGCIVERGVVYSQIVFTQILSGGSLCGRVDELVKILLCEGGDIVLGARTSKHILVFSFDPLSLTLSLSLILCLASFHIVHSYLYAWN